MRKWKPDQMQAVRRIKTAGQLEHVETKGASLPDEFLLYNAVAALCSCLSLLDSND